MRRGGAVVVEVGEVVWVVIGIHVVTGPIRIAVAVPIIRVAESRGDAKTHARSIRAVERSIRVRTVERTIERPVERTIERRPVERTIERRTVERTVERPAERTV